MRLELGLKHGQTKRQGCLGFEAAAVVAILTSMVQDHRGATPSVAVALGNIGGNS